MWAVIRESDGRLMNVVMWDGESPWTPPEGCRVEQYDPSVHKYPEVPVE